MIAELATHGANLVLLDAQGRTLASARKPKSAQERLAPGTLYTSPPLPARLTVPVGMAGEEIDRVVEDLVARGESAFEALRRHFFGVGTAAANLVVDEARATGRSVRDGSGGAAAADWSEVRTTRRSPARRIC